MSDHVPSILLVDDEARNLDALEAILDGQGYNLLRADHADLALSLLLAKDDIAAIVLDIQMPQLNGIELAKIIKGTRRFREIPILFLTAHRVDDADVIVGYGVGAVDYLTKPLNPAILKQKVQVFAELFKKTRALAELNEKLEERVLERTAELEKSEAALRAAARQKDEFLAVLAHELRNPLAPLRTGVALLTKQAAEKPAAARTLKMMDRQLDHLVRLIDDLLDVSRISNGVLELKRQDTDLGGVVQASIETFRSVCDQKKIRIEVDVGQHVALVDATRVTQIVGNLLHNACKFTPEGGVIRVSLTHEQTDVVIRVADSGVGIPSDQLHRVFEMFARVTRKSPQASSGDRGAGIGLALAQRLAQMHGGALSAWSAGEGLGTTLTLTLPASTATARSTAATPEATTTTTVTTTVTTAVQDAEGGLDILVIEDSPDVAETLVSWLEEEGHRVKSASTGEAGVELVMATHPDLVLCDVGLPEMDGTEVCRRVRAHEDGSGFHPIMVALTGWGQKEDRKRTHDAGFDHHLVKPVSLDVLTDVLAQAQRDTVERKRARRA